MKRLWSYMKHYKKESILGPLFKLLEASFELLVPLVVANIIDTGIASRDGSYVLKMGGVLILLGFVGLASSITAQYFAAKAAVGTSTAMRKALFEHLNSFSYKELDTIGTSTLITRITSDINQVQTGVNLVLRLFLRSPFIVFGAMIMAFTIDVRCATIFAAVIPVLFVVVFAIMGVTIPWYRRVQNELDRVLLHVRENLSGVRVVRAFNRQQEEMKTFHRDSTALMNTQLFVGRISGLLNPLTYAIINVAVILLVWTGGRQVDAGILSQGQVVALVNYMSQILVELIKLANLIINVTKSLACLSRINKILDQETGMAEGTVREQKQENGVLCVEFKDVSITYEEGADAALSHVSFRAYPGETIGIIGGTGSGKSTLVNLIPRFYDVTEGEVLVDGRNVQEYTYEGLRGKIGVVPQKAVLFSGTIRENLRWGKEDATDEELYAALETAQGREIVEKKEKGLDTEVLQGGRNLSGGQRQRLTIARALVRDPEILILDDSASALDFATDAKLRKALREHKEKATVFLVSQRAATIRQADQIIVLDDGAVAGIGKHEELYQNCEVYREICNSQVSAEEEKAHEA
ncbi:ABC transporter ATP-binding protein [Laedolimicola ammoniilytica]|uniref:ABC transporter ATP-binding protein/permease n=1 Tax=Laedolimicola ammoniilytica TaxID=2981771 RepID=A0ABT2RYY4_9FIRM|nr:ABC transporter ATP-binding protein [Laedolimicola ammoniilytica]MCU6697547.1 ABC transporter ATP-binding protein/permease [Laedolimicola ammoniilytica]SCI32330.1 Probable multidrug resistance ABC transporter ATP-binding/permease protein YheH [uncultured Clostridium sp.]